LRRPRRSIETFDIALMAVVTKAMGAFLVLMLIMLPSYNKVPGMQHEVHDADAALQRLAKRVEPLQQRNAVLQQRIAVLRAKSGAPAAAGGTIVSLLLTFSYASCNGFYFSTDGGFQGGVGFYARGENVTLADGANWPAVQLRDQDAPPGVVAYIGASKAEELLRQLHLDASDLSKEAWTTYLDGEDVHHSLDAPTRLSALMTKFVNTLDNRSYPTPEDEFRDHAPKQALWLINNLRPGAKFAIYAKPWGLVGDCKPRVGALVPEAMAANAESSAWNNWVLSSKENGHIVHLGYVVWTGRELQTLDPAAADQVQLDAQAERERAETKKNSNGAQ